VCLACVEAERARAYGRQGQEASDDGEVLHEHQLVNELLVAGRDRYAWNTTVATAVNAASAKAARAP